MPVNSTHRDYEAMRERWERMTDVCSGQDAIKAKGEVYLPRSNSDLSTPVELERYKNFKKRALFVEVTKDTLDKYTGQAFKDDPVLNIDERLSYMKRDANGAGLSIYQIAQKAFIAQMQLGGGLFLTDYPPVDEELSIAQAEQLNLRPTISFYPKTSIINWRVTHVGGKTQTSMIVLSEMAEEVNPDDVYVTKQVQQWRVLGIDDKGYYVEVWRMKESAKAGDDPFYLHQKRTHPTKANNENWQHIPVSLVGSDTNDWSEQKIPLESLAIVNIAHYQNSASYEDSVHYCGHVQPWMSGVSDQRMEALEKQEIRVGAGQMIMLEDNGKFGYAQPEPNTLAYQAMIDKYALMQDLGAKLAESQSQQKTATQSDHEASVQNSTASMCVANLNEAMHDAMLFAYEFMGIEHDESDCDYLFKAKQDFIAPKPDPAIMQAIAAWVMSNQMPQSVLYSYARRYNLIDPELKDEDIVELIEAQGGGMVQGALNE